MSEAESLLSSDSLALLSSSLDEVKNDETGLGFRFSVLRDTAEVEDVRETGAAAAVAVVEDPEGGGVFAFDCDPLGKSVSFSESDPCTMSS